MSDRRPPGRRSQLEMRNELRGRMERMLAAINRWGKAKEAATDNDAASAELEAAESQLLDVYREFSRREN